jgi:hypothetical protein
MSLWKVLFAVSAAVLPVEAARGVAHIAIAPQAKLTSLGAVPSVRIRLLLWASMVAVDGCR